MALSEKAKAARREYHRQWRAKNREKVNAYQKKWREENPEKFQEYVENSWEKKASE